MISHFLNKDFYFLSIICLVIGFHSCSVQESIEEKMKLSEQLLSSNSLDSAQVIIEDVIKIDSTNVNALNELAEIHFRKVEIGEALRLYQKSILYDSTNAETHFKIAEIKLFLGDYKNVFYSINNGLRINERKPLAYFMKGVAYKHIGDTAKAISSFKTAIELKNDFFSVYYELGLLLTHQKDTIAIDYYKNGVEVNPNDPGLLSSLAWCYNRFSKIEEANNTYNEMVELFPNYKLGKSNYAVFKYGLNEIDTALVLCNEVLSLDSSDYTILNLKGIILKDKGLFNEAALVKQKLSRLNSQSDF